MGKPLSQISTSSPYWAWVSSFDAQPNHFENRIEVLREGRRFGSSNVGFSHRCSFKDSLVRNRWARHWFRRALSESLTYHEHPQDSLDVKHCGKSQICC